MSAGEARRVGGRDRGLRAVARVREVRERDSRVGLLQALTNVRMRESELAARRQAVDAASSGSYGSLGEYVASRQLVMTTAHAVREAEQRFAASVTVATEARSRWQADKTRVRAIEHLLEVRAERARAEALRAEARETDDIVGGRRNPPTHHGPTEGGRA